MPELPGSPPTHEKPWPGKERPSLTMRSASGNQLPIIGAALMRIRLTQSGRETRQMVYISPKATKLYLSLSTCTDLGLIRDDFPRGQSTASIQDKQAKGTTKPSLPADPPEHSRPEKEPATARPCHCAPPPQWPTMHTAIPRHRGEPREVGEVPTRDLFVQHIQHLRTSDFADDVWPTSRSPHRPNSHPKTLPHPNTDTDPLAGGGEEGTGQRRPPRRA